MLYQNGQDIYTKYSYAARGLNRKCAIDVSLNNLVLSIEILVFLVVINYFLSDPTKEPDPEYTKLILYVFLTS